MAASENGELVRSGHRRHPSLPTGADPRGREAAYEPRVPRRPPAHPVQPRLPGAAPPPRPPRGRGHRIACPILPPLSPPSPLPPPSYAQDSSSRVVSHGCRVVICDYPRDPSRLELRMVHLLTGEETRLPSLVNFCNSFVLCGDILLNWGYFCSAFRFCRPGDADWTRASIGDAYCLEDMICVNGTIYTLVSTGHLLDEIFLDMPSYHLAVVELSENRSSVELVFLRDQLNARTMHLPVGTPLTLILAECRGELIIVSTIEYNPRVYHVFCWNSGEAKWAKITSLGGCALFFDCNSFKGGLGPDHPGIRKDCMYFTEEGLWSEYSLVDGSFLRSGATYPGGQSQGDFRAVWDFGSFRTCVDALLRAERCS